MTLCGEKPTIRLMHRSDHDGPSAPPLRMASSLGVTGLALLSCTLACLPSACATDESAPPPARLGAQPAPVASTTPAPAAGRNDDDDGGARDASVKDPVARTAFIYNRVLAKLKDPASVDVGRLEREVEKRTGAGVKEIKKGPMGLLSIIFDDVSPPRGESEQRALVEKLKGMQELQYVEPERLMQAR